MQTGEISPCSGSSRSSTVSYNSAEEHQRNAAISSLRSDGTPKTRTIAIAVKGHEKLRQEPFAYAFNHLVEQTNCKVVVISCLSQLHDDMGVTRAIDVETFGGVSKRKLEVAINDQIRNLNYFLKTFKERLDQRGVQYDIRVTAGPKNADILVQAARALHPHWVVLDRTFSGSQKKIQAELECNLVLMKKGTQQPDILKLTPKYLGPVDRIHEHISEEDMSFANGEFPNYSPGSRTPSSHSRNRNSDPTTLSSTSVTTQKTTETTSSTSSSKVYTCFTCMCFSGKAVNDFVDGPTENQTVLYGATTPGSRATYLGKMAHPKVTTEVTLLSSRISTPETGPAVSFFKMESSSVTKKSTTKSTKILEREMEAQMAMPSVEEDEHFRVRL